MTHFSLIAERQIKQHVKESMQGTIPKVLLKIDRTSEGKLRETLFRGFNYIDTPGNYRAEKKNYRDIYDYYKMNMGRNEFDKLLQFIISNPTQVKKFMNIH